MITLLLSLILSSCSFLYTQHTESNEFLSEFYSDMEAYGYMRPKEPIAIIFKPDLQDLSDTAAGACFYTTPRTIVISARHWNSMTKNKRRALIYHEAGHCILGKQHDGRRLSACPYSLMNHELPSLFCVEKYWEDYKRRLFLIH